MKHFLVYALIKTEKVMPQEKIIAFLSNRRVISSLFSLHFVYFLKLLLPYSPSLLKPSFIFYFIVQEQAWENKGCKIKHSSSLCPHPLTHFLLRDGDIEGTGQGTFSTWSVRTELTNTSMSVPQNLIYFSINHRDNLYIFMTYKAGERGSCWCCGQM